MKYLSACNGYGHEYWYTEGFVMEHGYERQHGDGITGNGQGNGEGTGASLRRRPLTTDQQLMYMMWMQGVGCG